jgi:hypothetical protein
VPAATAVPRRTTARAFFTGAMRDRRRPRRLTAARWFSEHTLPRAVEVGRVNAKALPGVLARSLVRPAPALPSRLSMIVATQPQGTTLRDPAGVCLARYRRDGGQLAWWFDDACELEQAATILPVVAGYEAGLLAWLARGQLALQVADGKVTVSARGLGLGAGTLTVLREDGRGVRASAGTAAITSATDGGALGTIAVGGGRFAVALFRGVDDAGEPVVAFGRVELP